MGPSGPSTRGAGHSVGMCPSTFDAEVPASLALLAHFCHGAPLRHVETEADVLAVQLREAPGEVLLGCLPAAAAALALALLVASAFSLVVHLPFCTCQLVCSALQLVRELLDAIVVRTALVDWTQARHE